MKKIIFVLSGLLLLSFSSCQKADIEPCQDREEIIRNIIIDDFGNGEKGDKGNVLRIELESDTLIGITDPNRDEDDERRVKRK